MLLCLSSGFTPRYREDVLRAISMPRGSHLRFRYELGLIPEYLKNDIENNQLRGEDVCIAYLDRSNPASVPEIVPCRKAKLCRSDTQGDFCVLVFELTDFWVASDIQTFNDEIYKNVKNLPYWEGSELKGNFCSSVNSVPTSLTNSSRIEDWQKLVKCLKNHIDFSSEPFFYNIRGVFPINKGARIEPLDGAYKLVANSSYEIRIVQSSPGETNQKVALKDINWLLADCDTQAMSFITNKLLAVDSGYDEKIIRFRTSNTVTGVDSMISIYRHVQVSMAPKIEDSIWDFDLLFHIEPKTLTTVRQGIGLGILVACQGLVPILSNSNITEKLWTSVVVVILGLATGLAASFGLRKP